METGSLAEAPEEDDGRAVELRKESYTMALTSRSAFWAHSSRYPSTARRGSTCSVSSGASPWGSPPPVGGALRRTSQRPPHCLCSGVLSVLAPSVRPCPSPSS